VVLEEKKLYDLAPLLHFCDYLPLDKNQALHLENF
jgi:hypothetical protein